MSKHQPPRPAPLKTAAQNIAAIQHEVDAALSDGVDAKDLVLKLTHRDNANLRRDPSLPTSAIQFDGGVMRFMGVKVETGGVDASILERSKPEA